MSFVAAVVMGARRRHHVLAECDRVFSVTFKVFLFFSVIVPLRLKYGCGTIKPGQKISEHSGTYDEMVEKYFRIQWFRKDPVV